MIVLDASAMLAFLFEEAGAPIVRDVLTESCASTVNLAEVLGRIVRDGHDPRPIRESLNDCGIEWVAFSADTAELAARLYDKTRHLGLSLGDRVCLALALQRGLPVLTADRAWSGLEIGVAVRLIR